jgi:hypothetical protein
MCQLYISHVFVEWNLRSRVLITLRYGRWSPFYARLQNCETRLLASSWLSVCLSVRPHGRTLFPLDSFSWNLVFVYLSNICLGNSSFIKIWQRITGTLHKDLCTFVIMSRPVLLRMRNVSNKAVEKIKPRILRSVKFFPKIVKKIAV